MTDADVYAEATRVTKCYGTSTALDAVDLVVRAGTVHGLVGPNGAGKTTLLSALLGLVLPEEGSIRLFGRTRAEAGGSSWLDGVGGFVETPRFYPHLTGRQNLRSLARLDDGPGVTADSINDMLAEVGLTGAAGDQRVRGYSLGMRQRLGLASSLLRGPRLLILDEPTNGLDVAGTRDVRALIRRLAAAGAAVLLSSHDMTQVEELCDTVTVLRRGHVAFDGDMPTLRALAPTASWQLSTSDDVRAAALGRSARDVLVCASDGGLLVAADQAALDAYVITLGAAGVAVRALRQSASPLESLLLSLLADGADENAAPALLARTP